MSTRLDGRQRRPRREWRTRQKLARRRASEIRSGKLCPALPDRLRFTACAALRYWAGCGCPESFTPPAERVAALAGCSARTVRRHYRELERCGIWERVEEHIGPRLLGQRGAWRSVAPGLCAAYELNCEALGVRHSGERHRTRPAVNQVVTDEPAGDPNPLLSDSVSASTNVGSETPTSHSDHLSGHGAPIDGPGDPLATVHASADELGGCRSGPPGDGGELDDDWLSDRADTATAATPGLALVDGVYRVSFPLSEADERPHLMEAPLAA